jgi:hypothetical protein
MASNMFYHFQSLAMLPEYMQYAAITCVCWVAATTYPQKLFYLSYWNGMGRRLEEARD